MPGWSVDQISAPTDEARRGSSHGTHWCSLAQQILAPPGRGASKLLQGWKEPSPYWTPPKRCWREHLPLYCPELMPSPCGSFCSAPAIEA
mmetsp:Transcript_120221/g.212211  ORF Transcript_120221/g.212211 Transcript_120221/m.212211 type:complete len:90 (-) Transcript_120221:222-491(-)